MFRKLSLIFALAFGLCWGGTTEVQAQNVPDEYIYFDLAAGTVNFSNAGAYEGYVYVEGNAQKITGRYNATNKYYIYQSSTIEGSPGYYTNTGYASQADFNARQNIRIPAYDPIMGPGGQDWEEYCTNNTDVVAVRNQWVSSAEAAKRTSTSENYVRWKAGGSDTLRYNVILDNVWSEFYNHEKGESAAMYFQPDTHGEFNIKLKNYSKLNHVKYDRNDSLGGGLHFTSIDGDGATTGSLVVTYTMEDGFRPDNASNKNASALIGGRYYGGASSAASCHDLYFDGGTVYVGLANYVSRGLHTCPTAIGGGANKSGEVTISGGVLTAIASTSGATIGGGGGTTGVGQEGKVTISGGEVYAYNFGLYNTALVNSAPLGTNTIAGTAIGGGSTKGSMDRAIGGAAEVTISGGYVYAQSVGGNAIGGGNSSYHSGGKGTVTITGGTVVAKSVSGNIGVGTESEAWSASTAIGGGAGGSFPSVSVTGGDAEIVITGSPTITAGSIGGGKSNNAFGKVGTAIVDIADNPDISAQFIMASGAEITPHFNMSGGTIHDSKTYDTVFEKTEKTRGGAVYLEDGDCTITGGQIYGCEATECGGAIFVKGGNVTISGGEVGAISTPEEPKNPNKAQQGGGVYVDVEGTDTVTISEPGSLINNEATNQGGGVYMNGGSIYMSSGTIYGNKAANDGGGFYVPGGNVTITGGTIQNNIATTGNGGGFYSDGGMVNVSNTVILGNQANSGNGGGFYVGGGNLYLSSGTIGANGEPNTAINGGGFYISGGVADISGGMVQYNEATNGGGLYISGGEANISGGMVQYNEATNGGGLYMIGSETDNSTANFYDGSFKFNSAMTGGGIYIADYATLNMSGMSSITDNHVPADSVGGGVFKSGQETSEIRVKGTGLKIVNNYSGSAYCDSLRNNLYLDKALDYLTIDENDTISGEVQVGVSIGNNLPKRIIYCSNFSFLNSLYMDLKQNYNSQNSGTGQNHSSIFDDASKYLPVFQGAPNPFTWDYIFFIQTWDGVFESVPVEFDPQAADGIKNATELTYFMMIQNNVRCEDWIRAHDNITQESIKNMEVKLGGDIDLTGLEGVADTLFWRPVSGDIDMLPFEGEFHGAGHTITGMQTIDYATCSYYGLFGKTKGATIDNMSVQNCRTTSGSAKAAGMLIGQMEGGSISNVIVSGIVDASGAGESSNTEEGNCNVGGLVGETVNNAPAQIRNCVSLAYIDAGFKMDDDLADKYYQDNRTVGGMVGVASTSTTIVNGFVLLRLIHGSWNPRFAGGFVGENNGTIMNSYVRWNNDGIFINQQPSPLAPGFPDNYPAGVHTKFGMFAGKNEGLISHCYAPDSAKFGHDYDYLYGGTTNGLDNYGDYDTVTCPYRYDTYMLDNKVTKINGEAVGGDIYLLDTLNGWVDQSNQASIYSHWMRTKSSPINDDYPIPMYDNNDSPQYSVVGCHFYHDTIPLMEYSKDINEILTRSNNLLRSNITGRSALFIYDKLEKPSETRDDAAMESDVITVNNDDNVKIYIDEDIPVLQSEGNELKNVYTCQELKMSSESWHTISSSLADSPIGIKYGKVDETKDFGNPNPCNATILGGGASMFLTETPIEKIDLYCFYEPHYHWLNLKRNSLSHWHRNNHTANIPYSGDDNSENNGTCILVPGKGYLAASFEQPTLMLEHGTLNNGEIAILVTTKAGYYNQEQGIPANSGTELRGYNLLGNPYQSYLSFSAFANNENNKKLWNGTTASYAVYDAETDQYLPGAAVTISRGSFAATGDINMHQGFFIVADNDGTATFDNTMRSDTPLDGTHFRGEAPAYPLVNLVVKDANGIGDVAVVEFDRPEYQSAAKMKSIGADGKIYFRYSGGDQALLFLDEPTDQLPVHFDCQDGGTYTLTWSTANADFSYLHLIDNMTGMDIDMLTSDGYTFTANADDYKSRFKMVFYYTGIGENEDTELAEAFAFFSNGDLIVSGKGNLQVIDMAGHVLYSTRLYDTQSRVSIPQVSAGIYLVRLNEKVQKIVIK